MFYTVVLTKKIQVLRCVLCALVHDSGIIRTE